MKKLITIETDLEIVDLKVDLNEDGCIYGMDINTTNPFGQPGDHIGDETAAQVWAILDGLDLRQAANINILFQGGDVQLSFDPEGKEYTWATPGAWIVDHIERWSSDEYLKWLAGKMAASLDSDSIQELFFDEMDADGYFKELHPGCSRCAAVQTLYLTPGGKLCAECRRLVVDIMGKAQEVLDE